MLIGWMSVRLSMVEEASKAAVRRVFEEIWNQGDVSLADELYHPDYVGYDPVAPDEGQAHGPADVKMFVEMVRTAVPDIHFTIEELIADGDKVIARWRLVGTQTGTLMGMPPTGRRGSVSGTIIYRVQEGLLVQAWMNWDAAGMLRQLGVQT